MSAPVHQHQIESIASSIRIARSLLDNICDDLTEVQWAGPDRERFQQAWQAEVTAHLDAAAASVSRMSTEAL